VLKCDWENDKPVGKCFLKKRDGSESIVELKNGKFEEVDQIDSE